MRACVAGAAALANARSAVGGVAAEFCFISLRWCWHAISMMANEMATIVARASTRCDNAAASAITAASKVDDGLFRVMA